MIDPPSGRVSEKASRWDRGRTEACDGGKSVSGGSLLDWGFCGFIEVEVDQNMLRGPHKLKGHTL